MTAEQKVYSIIENENLYLYKFVSKKHATSEIKISSNNGELTFMGFQYDTPIKKITKEQAICIVKKCCQSWRLLSFK